jgi:hypothetical protein
MSSYPGIYRARCIGVTGEDVKAYVPQVFGNVPIIVSNKTGEAPAPNSNGWVIFESAQASLPVWVTSATGVAPPVPQDDLFWPVSPSTLTTFPMPPAWRGRQVRLSYLASVGSTTCSYSYSGQIDDPTNPGTLITPPNEELPWLPTSAISIDFFLLTITVGEKATIPPPIVTTLLKLDVPTAPTFTWTDIGVVTAKELIFSQALPDTEQHIDYPPPTYPAAGPSSQEPAGFGFMLRAQLVP